MTAQKPLIVHIVFRFDYGGLENGVVNVVNGLVNGRFRHAIVALTESTDFSRRLNGNVPVYALHKRPAFLHHLVQARNSAAIRPTAVKAAAGVPSSALPKGRGGDVERQASALRGRYSPRNAFSVVAFGQ